MCYFFLLLSVVRQLSSFFSFVLIHLDNIMKLSTTEFSNNDLIICICEENFTQVFNAIQYVKELLSTVDNDNEHIKLLISLAVECRLIKDLINEKISNSLTKIKELRTDYILNFNSFKQSVIYKTEWKHVTQAVNHVTANQRKVKTAEEKMKKMWIEDEIDFFLTLNFKCSQKWMKTVNSLTLNSFFADAIKKINWALWSDQIMIHSEKSKKLIVNVTIVCVINYLFSEKNLFLFSEKLNKYNLTFNLFKLLVARDTAQSIEHYSKCFTILSLSSFKQQVFLNFSVKQLKNDKIVLLNSANTEFHSHFNSESDKSENELNIDFAQFNKLHTNIIYNNQSHADNSCINSESQTQFELQTDKSQINKSQIDTVHTSFISINSESQTQLESQTDKSQINKSQTDTVHTSSTLINFESQTQLESQTDES